MIEAGTTERPAGQEQEGAKKPAGQEQKGAAVSLPKGRAGEVSGWTLPGKPRSGQLA